jgi:5-methylcytosine-specific restriction endonuclease McrA
MLEQQGFRCSYSGLPLKIGVNAQVDHKVPRSRGGTNNVENLHWVDGQVNRMKTDFTHEEFLAMCTTVVELWQKKQNQLRIA